MTSLLKFRSPLFESGEPINREQLKNHEENQSPEKLEGGRKTITHYFDEIFIAMLIHPYESVT